MTVEQLQLRVTNVEFTYTSDNADLDAVRLRFNVTDPTGEINASGRVLVTTDEYINSPGLVALADLAREKLIARLEEPEESEEE